MTAATWRWTWIGDRCVIEAKQVFSHPNRASQVKWVLLLICGRRVPRAPPWWSAPQSCHPTCLIWLGFIEGAPLLRSLSDMCVPSPKIPRAPSSTSPHPHSCSLGRRTRSPPAWIIAIGMKFYMSRAVACAWSALFLTTCSRMFRRAGQVELAFRELGT